MHMIRVGECFEDLELQLGPFETFANSDHLGDARVNFQEVPAVEYRRGDAAGRM